MLYWETRSYTGYQLGRQTWRATKADNVVNFQDVQFLPLSLDLKEKPDSIKQKDLLVSASHQQILMTDWLNKFNASSGGYITVPGQSIILTFFKLINVKLGDEDSSEVLNPQHCSRDWICSPLSLPFLFLEGPFLCVSAVCMFSHLNNCFLFLFKFFFPFNSLTGRGNASKPPGQYQYCHQFDQTHVTFEEIKLYNILRYLFLILFNSSHFWQKIFKGSQFNQ